MSDRKSPRGSRRKASKNYFTTKNGNVIKVHRNILQRWVLSKDDKERRKAERKAGLPKSRVKRFFYHFQPKRMYHYWFSRDGAIMVLKITGIGIASGFVILVGLFAYFRKDLPNITDVSGTNLGGSISYYDRTGQTLLWQDYDAVKRIPVSDQNISPYIKDATVAVEDKNFYKEGGFDVRGIIRAGVNNVFHRGSTQGASTITEQLVKLTQDFNGNRTVAVKIKELILATDLDREYSKQQILTGYLNVAPYGNIEYGVEAAANDYFHESAKDITLPQAAFLAAIPKSPAFYSPYGPYFSQSDLVGREDYVLDQMAAQGMITKAQATAAKAVDVVASVQPQQNKYTGIKAPWFVLAAKTELENRYGSTTVNRGGWKVITTLDMNLQNKAESLVASNLPNVSRYGADEEAIVGEDIQTGQIVSLVGGTDFSQPQYGQNNYAAGILIPPGSSFKPYDYSTLINNNNNVGAGSVMYDSQTPLPGYPCTIKGLPPPKGNSNCLQDYDFLNPGPITLRYALGGSRNIPAVKAMLEAVPNDTSSGRVASVNKVISTASAMMDNPYVSGSTYNCYADTALTQTTQCYGASAIGDGAFLHLDDHVNGLATLARLGQAIPRTYILKITDSANKTVYQYQQPKPTQVLKPDTAYIVDNMASDPNASYLPGSCSATTCSPLSSGGYKFQRYNGWDIAVKTGTTNDGFDGLMTAWSTKYSVVSWVGNHTRNVNLNTTMESLTEPMTRGWIQAALDSTGSKPVNWTQPSDIKVLPAFVVRNHIHYGDIEPSPSTDLFPSWYQAPNNSNPNQTIDKVSGLTATSCTPSLAKQTSSNSNVSTFNVDEFVGGSASTGATSSSGGTDNVHQCSDSPPSIASFFINGQDASQGGSVTCTGSCSITTTVTAGTHPLSDPQYPQYPGTVNLIVNGQTVQSAQVSDSPSTVAFTLSGSGTEPVSVQVIDSVLYDSTSDQASVTFNTSNPITVNALAAHTPGNSVQVSWTGGSGNFTALVSKNGGSSTSQSCGTSSPCTVTLSGNASYAITIQDDQGDTSNQVTTSRP